MTTPLLLVMHGKGGRQPGRAWWIRMMGPAWALGRCVLLVYLLGAAGCRAPAVDASAGMDPYLKDLLDAVAKVAGLLTVVGAVVTVSLQLRRWQHDRTRAIADEEKLRAIRQEELRWRKASLARDAVGECLRDTEALAAMRMLDWEGRTFSFDNAAESIWAEDVARALRTTNLSFSAKESYIRDCFDAFFGHVELIEHFLGTSLLEFADVTFPFAYYAGLMARTRPVFEGFLKEYRYLNALRFLDRFEEWRAAAPSSAPVASRPM